MGKRVSAWELLVPDYFQNKDIADRWIRCGRVYIGNERMRYASQRVAPDADIRIKNYGRKYVGRGGEKLEGALASLNVQVRDAVVLDAGACTGGFTDCLLTHGAKLVYAVEAGTGQLHGRLRNDIRVVNLEHHNIGDPKLLSLSPTPSTAAVDLSYVSLRYAIPEIVDILHGDGTLVCLVKPLFEIQDATARRTGIIDNDVRYVEVLRGLASFVRGEGYRLFGVARSIIDGSGGTREFFIGLDAGKTVRHEPLRENTIDAVIDAAVFGP
ncbi:MAG: hypothetical protein HZC28_20315 [Spirochaetes bacterium]|nr:hypothetical protein [Spirochaetota bacterium]